jgi:hypothetical protein
MALNIPVNLMNVVVPVSQSPAESSGGIAAIQPAAGSAANRNTSADSGSGFGAGNGGTDQQVLMSKLRATLAKTTTPDRAEPKSIVAAQTAPVAKESGTTPSQKTQSTSEPRVSELDRYAPPDPLPTAPILLAPSFYTAQLETR